MPEITVDFEVYCGKCGRGICKNTYVKTRGYPGHEVCLEVHPCEKCLSDAEDEGYEKGRNEE